MNRRWRCGRAAMAARPKKICSLGHVVITYVDEVMCEPCEAVTRFWQCPMRVGAYRHLWELEEELTACHCEKADEEGEGEAAA